MLKVTYLLKSGAKITFKCEELKIQTNSGELVGTEVIGRVKKDKENPMFYVRMDDISAIQTKRVWF